MEIKFKKQMKNLQREVLLKSVDLDEDIEDFQIDIENYESKDKFITISPRCVRCNLCVEECPVDAITSSTYMKRSKIKDNCVKCEICAQTCPISCIYVMEINSTINKNEKDIKYRLKKLKVPHRVLRMEDIHVNMHKCVSCGICMKFCPTKAISLKDKSIIEAADYTNYPELKNQKYSYIDKELCIGCGSCVNLCSEGAIKLTRILGPVIEIKNLCIDQNACVECNLCEESCPVEAIKLEDGKIMLDNDKCVRCNICSSKCPVNALTLKTMDKSN